MKLKTVSVTYGRKFNLGDYNSATIDCTMWADLDDGDDESAVMGALWAMAKNNVKAQSLPILKQQQDAAEQILLGLPPELQEKITNANHRTD